ncbi:hypothetical protein [Acinetobacter nectaris]|uniref:hypothetical protein n=1 Tax=Acinetobacter nectaris TaxID=1219382 RepID=UPI001F3F42BB|nr:hypothetical protein [Acinetobacter nectaris]MCF8999679.1 hypothetical protein [Acinetobacter nectaris]MCF9028286.1 hypothetical protein [Acinetobacter nectaris]
MTKTRLKSLILQISRQLNAVQKNVYNLDLVTAIDHKQLQSISVQLNELYGAIDGFYGNQTQKHLSNFMEYTDLVKKRIDALAQYIRPSRLKAVHISPKLITQILDTEQQALSHLIVLLNDIDMEVVA